MILYSSVCTDSWPHKWSSQEKQALTDGLSSIILLQCTSIRVTEMVFRWHSLSNWWIFVVLVQNFYQFISENWQSFLWNGPKTNFGCSLVPICSLTINSGAAFFWLGIRGWSQGCGVSDEGGRKLVNTEVITLNMQMNSCRLLYVHTE